MLSVPIMELSLKFRKGLKVAIVHDVLLEYGGSERVVEELLRIFPGADFYTFYFNKSNRAIFAGFKNAKPKTSFFQNASFLYKLGRYFSITKAVSWLYFYLLDLSSYDLIISSSHSYNSKMVRKSKGQLHICYLYTPPKYLYGEMNELFFIKKFPLSLLLFPLFSFLRFIDKKAAFHPDKIIAISLEIKRRVARYYGREAFLVYPPVNLPKSLVVKTKKKSYFVAHSRLVRQKGIELIISTFSRFRIPLVVIGEGYLLNFLKSLAGPTVKFVGRVPDEKLPEIYSRARGLVYGSLDEDFGIVPVEAMAYGVPVVAYKSGGVKESVIDGKTGVLFSDYSEMGLYKAIKRLEKLFIDPGMCSRQANKFSKERFRKGILQLVESGLHEKFK